MSEKPSFMGGDAPKGTPAELSNIEALSGGPFSAGTSSSSSSNKDAPGKPSFMTGGGGTGAGRDTSPVSGSIQYRDDIAFERVAAAEKYDTPTLARFTSGLYTALTGKELPPTYDQIPQVVSALKAIEMDSIGGGIDQFLKSAIDFATTPEFALALGAMGEMALRDEPLRALVQYNANISDVIKATHARVGIDPYSPVNAQEQPNVSAAFDLAKMKVAPEVRDFMWSFMSDLPADQRNLPKTYKELQEEKTNNGMDIEAKLRLANSNQEARQILGYDISGATGFGGYLGPDSNVRGDMYRNYREEVAADLYLYLENNPILTDQDERDMIVWLWKTTEGKKAEILGRDSHLGKIGGVLDMPRQGMSNLATKAVVGVGNTVGVLGQARAPNDNLNNVHLSFGKNIAYLYGTSPGDGAGWGSSGPGKTILQGVSALPGLMFPATWPVSIYNAITGKENPMFGVPGWSSYFEEMGNASNWEWISGGFDFAGNIFLDPINYAANVGFGVKAAKTLARAEDVSKGVLALKAIVPFYGVHATGVRFPATSRLTWVFMSKTIDEGIDALKLSDKGRKLFNAAAAASGPTELMDRIPALAGKPDLAMATISAAAGNDYDLFWETWRVGMHGGLDQAPVQSSSHLVALLDSGDTKYHKSVQGALDNGQIGIRDAMDPTTGVDHLHPYTTTRLADEVPDPTEAGFFDAGVEARIFKVGPRLAESELVGEFAIKEGRVTVRYSGDTFAAFDEAGNFVGGVEHASTSARQIATIPAERGRGIGSLMRSMGGENPVPAISQSGSARAAFNRGGPTILTESTAEGDGARKVAINSKRGWTTIKATDKSLIKWLTDNGHMDLAAKLQSSGDKILTGDTSLSLFDFRLTALDDAEARLLEKYLDTVSDAHAFEHADELLLANRGKSKLLYGNDVEVRTPLERALPNESYEQAVNYAARRVASGDGHSQLTLINEMPRLKAFSGTTRINGRGRVSQFVRRAKAGIGTPQPHVINVGRVVEGGTDLRRYMELMGVSPETVRIVMDKWYLAASKEERYAIKLGMDAMIADDLGSIPAMKMGLIDYNRLHGERTYGRNGASEEIGNATRLSDGADTVHPTLLALMNDEMPLANVALMNRTRKRWLRAQRQPKILNRGFGQTKQNRQKLVKAYKSQLKRTDPKLLETISDDELLNIAYADVMGFGGRDNGLSMMNKVAGAGGKLYGAYHSMFTIAQLAFRPLPWAGRVLLEEQVRGWMMGLPSVYRNPIQYGLAFWDAHWIRAMPNKLVKQQAAAERSAKEIFTGNPGTIKQSIAAADEILPGFAKKVKDITDGNTIRAIYSHELSKSLIGTPKSLDIGSRGNMSMRTIMRESRVKRAAHNLDKRYNIDIDFDFFEDVGEIMNKSNVWALAEESQSSIKGLDWVPQLRRQDVSTYADAWTKKVQQVLGDRAGSYAVRRMVDRMNGMATENTALRFTQKQYWLDIRNNIQDVARYRGLNVDDAEAANYIDDVALARYYLDTIVSEDWLMSLLKPLWGDDMAEKARILDELANGNQAKVYMNGIEHNLDARSSKYAESKADHRELFYDAFDEGNFNFPSVSAYLHPGYGNGNLPGMPQLVRSFTNKIMETFGEKASLALHREPSYLFERRLWTGAMERLGWRTEDATFLAHQKATEMVNYTFFNNQHTGFIINRMNKAIPFFSAWAEVMTTWAWKIPSQNFLPLGYARMIHTMDKVMQGFVKLGLVEVGEDGQWHVNLEENPTQLNTAGRAASKGLLEWVQSPVNVIEQMANIARMMGEEFNQSLGDGESDGYKPVDFSAWKKDNYKLAIGSPVQINSHGIMGVNQFQFGGGPTINYAASKFLQRLPFAVDTELVEGDTLADMYEKLPSNVGIGQFLDVNELTLRESLGDEQYNLLWQAGGYLANPDLIGTEGLMLTVPGSSMMDSWLGDEIEKTFFPYGHVTTASGLIREIVPSGISYMLRGLGGIYANEGDMIDGFVGAITGPMEEYQISGEIAKQIIHLESTEGVVTKARLMQEELYRMSELAGFASVAEMRASITPGSEEGKKFTRISQDLQTLNDSILKRANDNAGMTLLMRGLMGFLAPATPAMLFSEEEVKGQWWGTREIAEAASVRGSAQWSEAIGNLTVRDSDDIERILMLTDAWMKDETGGEAKRWFKETYPTLLAWTNPTTYWGPGLAPPEQRTFDSFFADIEAGRKTAYPPEIMMQRISRTAIAAGYAANIVTRFGTDETAQLQGILNNWDEYLDLTQNMRMKKASLDMYDDDLNGGAYSEWRELNSEDKPVLYENILDNLYVLRSAADEMLALVDLANLDPEDQKTVNYALRQIVREYTTAVREIADEMAADEEFRNFREEGISLYFTEIAGPLYEATQAEYDKLDDAETAEDRSAVFEAVKVIKNEHFSTDQTIEVQGVEVAVPNEMERAWKLRDDEDKSYQVIQWLTRPAEWLDKFAINKIIETSPEMAEYVPTSDKQMALYNESAAAKSQISDYARRNPESMSQYERTQALKKVDNWLLSKLAAEGRHSEIAWIGAWPIEKLMLSGQLPISLREIGEYYVGIKNQLASIEDGKGPSSDEGRIRFNSLFFLLEEEWFPTHLQAETEFKKLGLNVFGEGGVAAIMARLYGSYMGELK